MPITPRLLLLPGLPSDTTSHTAFLESSWSIWEGLWRTYANTVLLDTRNLSVCRFGYSGSNPGGQQGTRGSLLKLVIWYPFLRPSMFSPANPSHMPADTPESAHTYRCVYPYTSGLLSCLLSFLPSTLSHFWSKHICLWYQSSGTLFSFSKAKPCLGQAFSS